MFYVRDLGITVLPEDALAERKADGGFTTCGGTTCLTPTHCGPDPCDCGADHSCFSGGTCRDDTKVCITRSLSPTADPTALEASIEAIEFHLAKLRERLKEKK